MGTFRTQTAFGVLLLLVGEAILIGAALDLRANIAQAIGAGIIVFFGWTLSLASQKEEPIKDAIGTIALGTIALIGLGVSIGYLYRGIGSGFSETLPSLVLFGICLYVVFWLVRSLRRDS